MPAAPAWAEKAVESMVFKAGDGAIAVISFYTTDPATQSEAVKSFYKTAKSFYKAIPGFYGLALFSSVDGLRAVELSQWDNQASYEAFQRSLATERDDGDYETYYKQYVKGGFKGVKDNAKESIGLGAPTVTTAFAIDQVISPPGMVSAIPGSTALVQISKITTGTPEFQAQLVTAAEDTLAHLPDLYPSPRTTVLLKGIEVPHVALLTYWGNAAEFSDLSQVPQLALPALPPAPEAEAEANEALAFTTDSHLYQTIKVITPKTDYGKG
ncbi:antibiotic biosynthesis monooxygenase [Leptolyngbya sp. KIOST-1]|uniref:antibiotic biosynthesis monooxygenase n=1 Tax=Leptolyngbya sp. KIOST-1 TaxID=1229172 RepID=UPI0018CCF684|nr:antibiotic biosynthesis monooxygenase [Leptolyngbya sp. KIOST-1]